MDEHNHEQEADEHGHDHEHVEGYLLDGAQMTVMTLIAGTVGYLKERGISPQSWAAYIGEHFEGSWDAFEGSSATETLENILPIQVESLGAELLSGTGNDDRVEVAVGVLPSRTVLEKFGTTPRELLRGFGITQAEFNIFDDMFKAPASAAGFRFTHKSGRGQHTIVLQRKGRKATAD